MARSDLGCRVDSRVRVRRSGLVSCRCIDKLLESQQESVAAICQVGQAFRGIFVEAATGLGAEPILTETIFQSRRRSGGVPKVLPEIAGDAVEDIQAAEVCGL